MALKALFSQHTFSVAAIEDFEAELQAPETYCQACQGLDTDDTTATKTAPERALGTMCFLPAKDKLARRGRLWTAERQARLNDGAFNHPCILVRPSGCGHLMLCAPCTSFRGQGIETKMAGARPDSDNRYRYVAIYGRRADADPLRAYHSILTPLELTSDDAAGDHKTTYVNLGTSFWIEKWALDPFRGTPQRVLTSSSLLYLRWAIALVDACGLGQEESLVKRPGSSSSSSSSASSSASSWSSWSSRGSDKSHEADSFTSTSSFPLLCWPECHSGWSDSALSAPAPLPYGPWAAPGGIFSHSGAKRAHSGFVVAPVQRFWPMAEACVLQEEQLEREKKKKKTNGARRVEPGRKKKKKLSLAATVFVPEQDRER